MKAVVTMGQGGLDQLVYKDVPVPILGAGEVLVRVLAAGMNNTDINTRMGWYADDVTASTADLAHQPLATPAVGGGWRQATPFPLIQGTDCCGVVVAVAPGEPSGLLDKRVLIRPCMRTNGFADFDNVWMASDFDGAFAEYVKVPATEVFPIESRWSDVELASLPCAYGTAENMLHRAQVGPADTVLVMGASGGVGSAAVQLAKRRGAEVIAVGSANSHPHLRALQVDHVYARGADLLEILGAHRVDVVVDNVAGEAFGRNLQLLKRGGRLVTSGAIAGPAVRLDLRQLYLKDITLIGSTAWDEPVFPNLLALVERNEIQPLVAKVFPLSQIAQAQTEFMQKQHFGKFVLVP